MKKRILGRYSLILMLIGIFLIMVLPASAEPDATPIRCGQTVTVENASTDFVYYSFVPTEGGWYDFSSSGDLDTYVVLYDRSMSQLASDDSGGENRNFLLHQFLTAHETYYVGVKIWSKTGSFTLTVQKTKHSGSCGEKATWAYADYVLSIAGTGEMTDYQNKNAPWRYLRNEITDIRIAEGVTSIGMKAFNSLDRVKYIDLPESIISIGDSAFAGCSKLVRISLPEGLSSIGDGAFASCSSLRFAKLPESLQTLGRSAFNSCGALTEMTIPGSVSTIEASTFLLCTRLKNIVIGHGVTSIGKQAFYSCLNLKELSLPETIEEIDEEAFVLCYGLEKVNYPGTASQWAKVAVGGQNGTLQICMKVKTADSGTYENLTWKLSDGKKLTISGSGEMPAFAARKNIYNSIAGSTAPWDIYQHVATVIEVSGNITNIGDFAFVGFDRLQNILLPDTVTSFEQYAFYLCKTVQMHLPAKLCSIGYAAMSRMDNLMNVDFPKTLTTLGEWAFSSSCFRRVHIPAGLKEIPDYAFYGVPTLCIVDYDGTQGQWEKISIGEENRALETATLYCADSDYKIASSGSCGENAKWSLDTEGVLTIYGSGDMANYKKTSTGYTSITGEAYIFSSAISSAPWGTEPQKLTKIVVKSGITHIGSCAFFNCFNVKSVSLPNTLVSIGSDAFSAMSGLTSLTIPDSVTTLSARCFDGCYRLESIQLSSSLTKIPANCFSSCSSIRTLTVPEGVEIIHGSAFADMNLNAEIILPSTLRSITRIGLGYDDGLDYGRITDRTSHWTLRFHGPLPEGLQDWLLLRANVYCQPEYYEQYKAFLLPYVYQIKPDGYGDLNPGTLSSGTVAVQLSENQVNINEMQSKVQLTATVSGTKNPSIAFTSTNEKLMTVTKDGTLRLKGLSGGAIAIAEASWNGFQSIAFCRVQFIHTRVNSQFVFTLPTEGIQPNYLATGGAIFQGEGDKYYGGFAGYMPRMYVESNTGRAEYQELKKLTDSLTAGCSTDREKVSNILDWVDENVEYKSPPLCIGETPDQAYAVYKNKIGNCQGFSKLAGYMITLANIPVGIVTNGEHMWNVVYLDGKWEMVDAQGGSFAFYTDYSRTIYTNIESIFFTQGDLIFVVNQPGEIRLAGVGINDMAEERAKVTKVTIPDFVDMIFGRALAECVNLQEVTIPEGVMAIGVGAFSGDTSLTTVTIPGSVTRIDSSAFNKCPNVTIHCPSGSYAHLFAICQEIPYKLTDGKEEHVLRLPSFLNEIESEAFAGFKSVILVVPETVSMIAEDAFEDSNLTLWVKQNSYAHQWAISNGIPYLTY